MAVPAVSDAVVARACFAAGGRLRGVRCVRLAPEALARRLGVAGGAPLVSLETLPDPFGVVGAILAPTIVVFDRVPPVATNHAAAGGWRAATRRQTPWTEYAFGPEPLFPVERPLVLAAPADARDDAAYLEHAASLARAPIVVLANAAAAARLAAAAGAETLADGEPDAPAAAAAAGAGLAALNVHATFAQALPAAAASGGPARRVLAVAAAAATADVAAGLARLATALAAASEDGGLDAAVRDALDVDRALLAGGGGAVFDCAMEGVALPLAPVGTTLGGFAAPDAAAVAA